jgi:hypothetical protein
MSEERRRRPSVANDLWPPEEALVVEELLNQMDIRDIELNWVDIRWHALWFLLDMVYYFGLKAGRQQSTDSRQQMRGQTITRLPF